MQENNFSTAEAARSPGLPVRAARGRWIVLAWMGLALWLLFGAQSAFAGPKVYLIDLKGGVGPVSADFVVRSLKKADDNNAAAIVLRIDTPGGLDTSMRAIVQAILSSSVPVVGYVAPGGARAASAGTFILYACPVAAMAPGTNLGAATPVSLFGDFGGSSPKPAKPESSAGGKSNQVRPPDAEMAKVTNDAVAYIRSLAKLNGRNADWAETAIRDAASLPAGEALKKNVIDLVADNLPDLLQKLDGRSVDVHGRALTLNLSGASVVTLQPGLRTQFLTLLTDPNVAFILLLAGVWGLTLEFSHPGIFAPGVIGGICLLLGLLALSIIPVNFAGLGLTALGLGLMVAEAFVPSFGALGIGGLTAFVLGAMMTFDTPGYRLAWPVVAGTAAVSATLLVLVVGMLLRARRRPVTSGDATMLGAEARVLAWTGEEGEVQAFGERWHARAGVSLSVGQTVRIVGRDGLTLQVEPA